MSTCPNEWLGSQDKNVGSNALQELILFFRNVLCFLMALKIPLLGTGTQGYGFGVLSL
jgi:hypothetical protein